MNKIVIALAAMLCIAGCTTTRTIVNDQSEFVVVRPPSSLFNCPQIGKIPNPATLTNKQVAEFIEKLYKYNKVCKINMDQIRAFIDAAEAKYK